MGLFLAVGEPGAGESFLGFADVGYGLICCGGGED